MSSAPLGTVLRHIRHIAAPRAAGPSDAALLARFTSARDPEAFAALVERYGALVWGACRRVLADAHECEDVFQAAFLTLARKAPSLDGGRPLANWLYTVAARLALKVKARSRRHPALAEAAEPRCDRDPLAELSGRELCRAFDEELQRLPEKFRAPVVLCCLEGKARDEAADLLGCTLGALKSRLERGRDLLRKRLARRGLHLPAALLAASVTASAAPAAVRELALRAALGGAPARVAALAGTGFALNKLALAGLALLAAGLIGVASGLLADPPKPQPAPKPEALPDPIKVADVPPRTDRFGDPLPDGAVERFGTARFRQSFLVRKVVFSPDGKQVAVAGAGRGLGVWDATTGAEVFQTGIRNEPDGIAYSPDGKLLAEGDRNVRLWDPHTGKLVRELKGHAQSARAVAFRPDGRVIATGGHDKTVRLWDPATGAELLKIEGHSDSVLALAFSPDGKLLASAGSDKVVRLWWAASGEPVRELKGHQAVVTSLSFAPDGKTLISSGDDPSAFLWSVASGHLKRKLGGGLGKVPAATFSPDGKLIATANGDNSVRLWDADSGKEVRRWVGHAFRPLGIAFSPDGKTLATAAAWECGPRFWDVATGHEVRATTGHRGPVREVWFAPDGKTLVSVSDDRKVIAWDRGTGDGRVLFTGKDGYFIRSATSTDGRLFASIGHAGPEGAIRYQARVWDAAGAHLGDFGDFKKWPRALAFSPGGRLLAVGSEGKVAEVWDVAAHKRVLRLDGLPGAVFAATFLPDGHTLVLGLRSVNIAPEDAIQFWDVRTGKKVRSLEHPGEWIELSASPDGRWLVATGFGEKPVIVYDLTEGKVAHVLLGHEHGTYHAAFSPDGRLLATGGDEGDNTVRVWELATGRQIHCFRGHHSSVSGLAFSADGRTLASGGGDSTILLWDLTGRSGKAARPLAGPAGVEQAWAALAGDDTTAAYRAVWDMADSPAAVALLRERLRPAAAVDAKRFRRLVAELDAENFRVRERAAKELRALGGAAEPLLRETLAGKLSAEARARLNRVLRDLTESSEWPRTLRALTALEHAKTAEARRLLEELAGGVPEARLTQEAKAALGRE